MAKREEPHVHIEPLFRFETVRGSTTIKTALYDIGESADEFKARVTREQIIAQHRAEQLEPVRKRPEREPREVFNYGKDDFDGEEKPRGYRTDRKPRNERARY